MAAGVVPGHGSIALLSLIPLLSEISTRNYLRKAKDRLQETFLKNSANISISSLLDAPISLKNFSFSDPGIVTVFRCFILFFLHQLVNALENKGICAKF